MPESISFGELLLRLLTPALFGGVIGWERESLDKPAGFRTHMMVGLGAACFTLVALTLNEQLGPSSGNIDPTRVIQGIVGGIGFLGAGSIIKGARSPHGLTTAAGIWTTGGVGAACGAGYFGIAGATAVVALGVLLLGRLSLGGSRD